MLYIDIGNSAVKLQFRDAQGAVRWTVRAETRPLDSVADRLGAAFAQYAGFDPGEAWGVSVCEAAIAGVEELLGRRVRWVGRHFPFPVPPDVEAPEQVGPDRVLNAYAAFQHSEEDRTAVAVACGTAITCDVAGEDGRFLGGCILPGIGLGARALHEFTERLPLVQPRVPDSFPPGTTSKAISAGLVLGAAGAIERILNEVRVRLRVPLDVVLTGGDAGLIYEVICEEPLLVPDLTLEGLALAVEKHLSGG